jgi:L-lactate dehydrogenase complex protein LldG
MTSREKMLAAVAQNKPAPVPLPDLGQFDAPAGQWEPAHLADRFSAVLTGIGGQVVPVASLAEVASYVAQHFGPPARCITTLPELAAVAETDWLAADPHSLQNVELAILRGQFGVAENGAIWLAEAEMGQRAVPYICQHLAVVLPATEVVPTMHAAYVRLGAGTGDFGCFIAGPSKTADIEQSLVLGAHGPKTMTVFWWAPDREPAP